MFEKETMVLVLLVFIILQIGLITYQMVTIMGAIVNVRKMVHDHVHGITNYLAEMTSELRVMRMRHDTTEPEAQDSECDKAKVKVHPKTDDHGHHHN